MYNIEMTLVMGIAETRAGLAGIIEQLENDRVESVVIGAHRKPRAAIISYHRYSELTRDATKDAPQSVLEKLASHSDLIRRIASLSHITSVSVFGSVARGDDGPKSDIDLLVDIGPEGSLFDLARFGSDMELLFNRPVDVVSRGGLDLHSDAEILKDAVRL